MRKLNWLDRRFLMSVLLGGLFSSGVLAVDESREHSDNTLNPVIDKMGLYKTGDFEDDVVSENEFLKEEEKLRRNPTSFNQSSHQSSIFNREFDVALNLGGDFELKEEDIGPGFHFGGEFHYHLRPDISLGGALGMTLATIDRRAVSESISFLLIQARANYHFVDYLPGAYAGLALGLTSVFGENIDSESDLSFGFQAGYDYHVWEDLTVGGQFRIAFDSSGEIQPTLLGLFANAKYWF